MSYVGGAGTGCGTPCYGGFTSIGAILVLFILLVIITKAFLFC
ncbi:sporulation protein YjcZ [Paenibacillus beijingensis]|nr:sporulation protein YjcZ [Paenibacillus beijingensis]